MTIKPWTAAVAAILLMLVATAGSGQPYPGGPLRIIVPEARFGFADISARLVALKLTDTLGQQILVENRIGAGGTIGTAAVARAAPDGHTLLVVPETYVANPYVFKHLDYDAAADFAPISLLVRTPLVLLINPGVPAKTVHDLVRLANARPGAVNFATVGPGSLARLMMEMLKLEANVNVTSVPYEGAEPALAELVEGNVDAMFAAVPGAVNHVRTGRLRALAVTSETPGDALPEVPLMKEFYPGFVGQSWVGMLAPAGTPPAVIARLNAEVAAVLRSEEMKIRFKDLGLETVGTSAGEFGQLIQRELERWGRVIRAQKVTVE